MTRRGIDINNDAFDLKDLFVADQWIFPGFKLRVSHPGVGQVHFPDATAVVLKSCDASGIGGPQHDRTVAANPAGIVRRISEIFDAVLGELGVPAVRQVANPEIEVTDEDRAFAVR